MGNYLKALFLLALVQNYQHINTYKRSYNKKCRMSIISMMYSLLHLRKSMESLILLKTEF